MRVKDSKLLSNPLLDAISQIQKNTSGDVQKKEEIVDIITFCNDPKYLDLPNHGFKIWLSQRVILKCFYIGSRGNENLKLTDEEWKWLQSHVQNEERDGIVYEKNVADVVAKLEKREIEPFEFRELHLVLGRRSSKTVMASIITSYEVYKLLVINNGDPHGFYNLPHDDEIAIINVALSQQQAGRLFGHIQSRLRNSPFFADKIAKETTSEIRLYTKTDLKKKAKGSSLSVPGSIVILCGHSNPDTLAGYNAILILFDELAFYEETGKVTGRYFYDRLKPSMAYFYKYGDGRTVQISSPNVMNGIFYETFLNSKKFDHILSFQLPTWCVSEGITYDHPDLQSDRARNPDMFAVEYGAQWAKSGTYGHYFPEDLIKRCVDAGILNGVTPQSQSHYGLAYYLHVDPALSGDRYVAVMVARIPYMDGHRQRTRVMLVNTWFWEPKPGFGLQYTEIDKEMIAICSKFRPQVVTYDQFNSAQSLQLLKSHGVNCFQIPFNRGVKNRIFQNLREKMAHLPEPEVWLYDDPRLLLELKSLKYRPTNRGISFMTDKHGEAKTDDFVDCLAGAVAMASENIIMPLPAAITVNMGNRFGTQGFSYPKR